MTTGGNLETHLDLEDSRSARFCDHVQQQLHSALPVAGGVVEQKVQRTRGEEYQEQQAYNASFSSADLRTTVVDNNQLLLLATPSHGNFSKLADLQWLEVGQHVARASTPRLEAKFSMSNSFAILQQNAEELQDLVKQTMDRACHSAGASPKRSEKRAGERRISMENFQELIGSVQHLRRFKELLDIQLKVSNLLSDVCPQGAILDTKDVELLNNLAKKLG